MKIYFNYDFYFYLYCIRFAFMAINHFSPALLDFSTTETPSFK
jgi:hypothetical protein